MATRHRPVRKRTDTITLPEARQYAFQCAIESLAIGKYIMFGSWATVYVQLSLLDPVKEPSPFRPLRHLAQKMSTHHNNQTPLWPKETTDE